MRYYKENNVNNSGRTIPSERGFHCSAPEIIQSSERFIKDSPIISLLLLTRFSKTRVLCWGITKFREGYSLFKLSHLLVKTVHTAQCVFWLRRHRGGFSFAGFWLPLARTLPAKKKAWLCIPAHSSFRISSNDTRFVLSFSFLFSLLFLSFLLYFKNIFPFQLDCINTDGMVNFPWFLAVGNWSISTCSNNENCT